MPPILMSVDNPEGRKLEELLAQIAEELQGKSDKLKDSDGFVDEQIVQRNGNIILLLNEAEKIQKGTMQLMEVFGPDPGPYGEPRT